MDATMERLPLETQTLYAEMMEQLIALEAQRSIGHASGCFTTKVIKGTPYYYFQYLEPGGCPFPYLPFDDPVANARIRS